MLTPLQDALWQLTTDLPSVNESRPQTRRARTSAMGPLEFCGLLGGRLVQHKHVDDFGFHDRWRPVVVAVVVVRLDRVRHLGLLRHPDRPNWCDIPHRLPRRFAIVLWYLG